MSTPTYPPIFLCSNIFFTLLNVWFIFYNYIISISSSRHLAQAETEISVNALQILAKNRRKLLLEKLLKSLRLVKTLQQTGLRLKELLQVRIFPSYIFFIYKS